MEVLVGPTYAIEVSSSSSPPTPHTHHHPTREADDRAVVSTCLFRRPERGGAGFRIGGQPESLESESSDSSSSIGTPDDSDNDLSFKRDGDVEEEEDEVQSKFTGMGSLDSLEDSLPIKRGLSSHFDGKSKSFSDLSQITNVKDLKKQENPFNKRRRVLIASKLSRRSAFYSWSNPQSMPLLPVDEDEDDDEEEEKARKVPSPSSTSSSSSSLTEEKKQENQVQLRQSRVPESYAARMRLRLGSFKSRSFSLADLQEHDDEEEDDD